MKKLIFIIYIFIISVSCQAQIPDQTDMNKIKVLTIEGLRDIRHDALIRFKFHYAYKINSEIKQLKQQIKP